MFMGKKGCEGSTESRYGVKSWFNDDRTHSVFPFFLDKSARKIYYSM